VAAPSPTPTATPAPTTPASPEPNLRPVAKLVIKIEFIDCPTGELNLRGPFNWTSVGCRIHMDMTPRDKYNKPTDGAKGHPDWILNDPSLVYFRPATYTPVLRAEKAGKLIIQGELDGIKSNQIQIHLYDIPVAPPRRTLQNRGFGGRRRGLMGKRILVVDDDEEHPEPREDHPGAEGSTSPAPGGAEALKLAEGTSTSSS
jgi:hypothetical protein